MEVNSYIFDGHLENYVPKGVLGDLDSIVSEFKIVKLGFLKFIHGPRSSEYILLEDEILSGLDQPLFGKERLVFIRSLQFVTDYVCAYIANEVRRVGDQFILTTNGFCFILSPIQEERHDVKYISSKQSIRNQLFGPLSQLHR